MNKTLLLVTSVFLTFSGTVGAEGYVEIGAGLADSDYAYEITQGCEQKSFTKISCVATPTNLRGVVGTVEFGYTSRTWTVYFSHTSLINEKDGSGMNILGVKKRIKLFE